MVCIHCITGYLPQALSFLFPIMLWFSRRFFTKSSPARPPVYGPWYLPPFVRGIMAMLQLGANEDAFLLSARKLYGPVVYIPWPLSQVFVLDGELINTVYSTPSKTLSFVPIRMSMQHSAFGTSKTITQSPIMQSQIFPTHAKGLTTVRIEAPIRRFINVVEARIVELGNKIDTGGGTLEMELMHWVVDTMFDGMRRIYSRLIRCLTFFDSLRSCIRRALRRDFYAPHTRKQFQKQFHLI
jgi:hypothetical protein